MPKRKDFKLKGKAFLWPGEQGNWHFVGVDKKTSADIKENFGKNAKGFRSIPVTVTIGKTSWDTSIFPDSKSGQYLLPLKAKVRKTEDIYADEMVLYQLKIRM